MLVSHFKLLQATKLSACGGQQIVNTTLATYQNMRTDECFSHFWEYLESRRSSLDVSSPQSPVLPRRRKVPRQFEVGMSVSENHDTVMVHYSVISQELY